MFIYFYMINDMLYVYACIDIVPFLPLHEQPCYFQFTLLTFHCLFLQVNSAFVWAVAQAAEKVIDGFVDSVSGSHEDPAFLCGGVFMSMPAHRDHLLGGERSHRAAQRHELRCVQVYSDLDGDLQNLHTIPTALADYRGVRMSAQGLAPGIQGSEQAEVPNGLLYGYSAGPLENPSRRKLLELLAQSAKALSLQRHAVLGPNGHQVPLFTSLDAQGILGADGRYYLLDVYRTMPADVNFHVEDGEGAETEEGSFPRRYPHVLCRLRPELVKAFIQHKWVLTGFPSDFIGWSHRWPCPNNIGWASVGL